MTDTPTRIAVVVMIVGEKYVREFENNYKGSVSHYCERHGYDFYVLDQLIMPLEPFDRKKFFWQRFLIPSLPELKSYDYVLVIDADIFISPIAPALPILQPGKFGCINERKYLGNYDWRILVQEARGWERTGKDWYALSGEEKDYHDHIQGGVVLYQPKYHADLLLKLYEENIDNYMKWHQDDQSFLSSYGIDRDMIEWMDQRYDCVWVFWRDIMYPGFDRYSPDLKKLLVKRFIQLNWFTHWTMNLDVDVLQSVVNG